MCRIDDRISTRRTIPVHRRLVTGCRLPLRATVLVLTLRSTDVSIATQPLTLTIADKSHGSTARVVTVASQRAVGWANRVKASRPVAKILWQRFAA
jgi:hypothetical protein